jgi:UDPglucose--hexose-1-phosphate uridylyltransferase
VSTLRRHPLTGEWVLVAPTRGLRPNAFDTSGPRVRISPSECPFCPGNETQTPPEILRRGSAVRWELRVVPNRYPAIDEQSRGAHEVVIESPEHDARFETLPLPKATMVLGAYQERYRALQSRHELRFITIFKNDGEDSGQSIDHLHSQIVGLPLVPPRAQLLASGFERNPCVLCTAASGGESLVVMRTEKFVSLVPAVPLFPYEQWIVPAQHDDSFLAVAAADLEDLARLMQDAVRAICRALNQPSFHWIMQNAPLPGSPSFHWFVQLFPRVTRQGGFELGTGMQINIVDPREAAEKLRGAIRP